jgi:Methyltransferase domain
MWLCRSTTSDQSIRRDDLADDGGHVPHVHHHDHDVRTDVHEVRSPEVRPGRAVHGPYLIRELGRPACTTPHPNCPGPRPSGRGSRRPSGPGLPRARTLTSHRRSARAVPASARAVGGRSRRAGAARPGAQWLVDVGAGSGGVTSLLGWDPDRVAVVEGSEMLLREAHRCHGLAGYQGEVDRFALRDGSLDVVCLLDAIEHRHDPRATLEEAHRVLARDGHLVITVSAYRWLWSERTSSSATSDVHKCELA